MTTVRCLEQAQLDPAVARELARLSLQTWPGGELADRLKRFLTPSANPPDLPAPHGRVFHVIEQGDRVLAAGYSFGRRIATPSGPMTVLAMGGVCCEPASRGRGLGKAIVLSAFGRVDDGTFPLALYQTTPAVRAFYEKLGARQIDNLVINSLDIKSAGPQPPSAPQQPKRAFWDPIVMIYPAAAPWPQGTVDLLGPGY